MPPVRVVLLQLVPWGDAKKGLQTMDAKKKAMIIKCTPPCTIHTHTQRQLPVSVCFGIRVASHIAPLQSTRGRGRTPAFPSVFPLELSPVFIYLAVVRHGEDGVQQGGGRPGSDRVSEGA
jgi:hypothetical protein